VLAAGPLGIMQACLDVGDALCARAQAVSAQPIGSFQLVQGKIADMYTTMNASRRLCVRRRKKPATAARTNARGMRAGAILYASEKATQCTLDAIQLLGGNGYNQRLSHGAAIARRQALRDRRRPPARSGAC